MMPYTDRPTAGQQRSYARDTRLIPTIRRPAGSTLLIPVGKE